MNSNLTYTNQSKTKKDVQNPPIKQQLENTVMVHVRNCSEIPFLRPASLIVSTMLAL